MINNISARVSFFNVNGSLVCLFASSDRIINLINDDNPMAIISPFRLNILVNIKININESKLVIRVVIIKLFSFLLACNIIINSGLKYVKKYSGDSMWTSFSDDVLSNNSFRNSVG